MKTLATDVYKVIRHRVSTGELAPGSRVAEFALSKELGVSRAPIREAIGKLATEGLLERVPNVGTFVRIPDADELRQNLELRAWIEGSAVAKTATQVTEATLAQLQRCCDEMRRLTDHQKKTGAEFMIGEDNYRFAQADLSFHIILLKASGNERALSFLTNQHLLSRVWSSIDVPQALRGSIETCDEHDQILAALRARNPEAAASLLKKHILGGMERVMGHLETIRAHQKNSYTLAPKNAVLEKQLQIIENWESQQTPSASIEDS